MSYGARQEPRRRPIKLHIDKLVLNGFRPGDRYRIGEGVQSELSRLLTEHGINSGLVQSMSIDRLNAGSFSMSFGMSALNQGHQTAQAVYRGFEHLGNGTGCNGERNQSNGDNDKSHGE